MANDPWVNAPAFVRQPKPTTKAKPITPEQLAASGSEDAHQSALFCWAALEVAAGRNKQLALMFAIPNGGQRGDGTERGAAIAGSRFKATGVKEGTPDLFLPISMWVLGQCAFHGLFIEMKKPKGRTRAGQVRSEQTQFHIRLREQGYAVVSAYGWEAARDTIIAYLAGEPLTEVAR